MEKGNKKKIGITVDAYKLDKYKEALEKLGFEKNVDFETTQIFRDGTMLIGVYVPPAEFTSTTKLIQDMCTRLELAFKQKRSI